MTLIVVCSECSTSVAADYIADDDGARWFCCCVCGMSSAEWDFSNSNSRRSNGASEIASPTTSLTGGTGTAAWAAVVSLSPI